MDNKKVLIKAVGNGGDGYISFKLTGKAMLNGSGLSTDQWYVSWDKIGRALFGDQYSDAVYVSELDKERKEERQ